MDVHQLSPIVSRRRAALMLGALALLVSAAPEGTRLIFDPSALAEEGCLAPALAGDGCSYGGFVEPSGQNGVSASAALLEPQSWSEREPSLPAPRAVRLEPDLSGLLDFGPEVVHRIPPRRTRAVPPVRIAAGSGRVRACIAAGRHRPDRSRCAGSGPGPDRSRWKRHALRPKA
ncbi:MAG: hypothetical protein M3N39_03120 [Pseudomonadota bacterium]|nr:hypothetical protein [Pseudomonadota bacterium]